jgi:hypothetical protein
LPEGLSIGDVIKIDDVCYTYNGEVECEGDESGASYGDVYEDCEECECVCTEYENCNDAEDIIYLKRCSSEAMGVSGGDVIYYSGECYTQIGNVACEGGEIELTDPDIRETCEECCVCGRFEKCDDEEDIVYLKLCTEEAKNLSVGDVIYYNGVCRTYTGNESCEGDETELTAPEIYNDCEECHGNCENCVGPLCSCSGQKTFPLVRQGPGCGGGNPINITVTATWNWTGTTFSAGIGFGGDGGPTAINQVFPPGPSCSGPFTPTSGGVSLSACDFSGASLTVVEGAGGYTFIVSGVANNPSFNCGCTAYNGSWFVPCTPPP